MASSGDEPDSMYGLLARAVRIAEDTLTYRFLLRPEPHRFADFRVLRHAEVPAVLFEAGYISNVEDEALLVQPKERARIVAALAQAIEADVASRNVR